MSTNEPPVDGPAALPELVAVGGPLDELWLRIGDRAFPDERWSDLPHTFDRWVPQVLPLLVGSPGRAELQFHDGPFRALIESDGTWRWQVTLVERARRTRLEADGSRFGRSLLRAASARARAADGSTELSSWVDHIKRALATSER